MADDVAEVQLPETKPYRVKIGGAAYDKPVIVYNEKGEGEVRYVRDFKRRGEVVGLVPREAHRLSQPHIDAVVEADRDLTYDEMDDRLFEAEVARRGITVTSSSADPDRPLRSDYVAALTLHDQGQDDAVLESVGVGTFAGGVARTDAREPEAAAFDAGTASVEQVADRITGEKLNASDTVALAGDDPGLAEKVLEAERAAQSGDPRATVEGPLQKIIDG